MVSCTKQLLPRAIHNTASSQSSCLPWSTCFVVPVLLSALVYMLCQGPVWARLSVWGWLEQTEGYTIQTRVITLIRCLTMQARDKKQKATRRRGQGQSQTPLTPHTRSWGLKTRDIMCVTRPSELRERKMVTMLCVLQMRAHTHTHTHRAACHYSQGVLRTPQSY
jgi:hypothetical protein